MAHPAIDRALKQEGRITFARFMQMALYHPRWGYYSRREALGELGDFYTSPELHPFFAASVAVRADAVWRAMGAPGTFDFVEVGGGSGRLARDVLLYVQDRLPELSEALQYRIHDRGASQREAQLRRLQEAGLDRRVRWTDGTWAGWVGQSVRGMIVANELLDALSVHLITARSGTLQELYVTSDGSRLDLEPGEPSTPELARYFESIDVHVPDGVQWEVNLNAPRWMSRAASRLIAGAFLLIDYGYPADELYSDRRPTGTLLCYARHMMHSDPLSRPGEQDITSHVDLTMLRSSFEKARLQIVEDHPQVDALHEPTVAGWRGWTLEQNTRWALKAGMARSLDALADPEGLGRLQWLLAVRGLTGELSLRPPRTPSSPKLLDDHLALPDPSALDPMMDIEAQWREMWEGDDDEKPV